MNCPSCHSTLQLAERQGVEIDYCPSCRGVWLDRGELDKIIERLGPGPAVGHASPADYREGRRRYERDDDDEWREDRYRYDRDYPHQRGKRRNFLRDLFDFD